MAKPSSAKKREYNQTHMGTPGTEKRRAYLDATNRRRGEIGSAKRLAYNIYMRVYRKTH